MWPFCALALILSQVSVECFGGTFNLFDGLKDQKKEAETDVLRLQIMTAKTRISHDCKNSYGWRGPDCVWRIPIISKEMCVQPLMLVAIAASGVVGGWKNEGRKFSAYWPVV